MAKPKKKKSKTKMLYTEPRSWTRGESIDYLTERLCKKFDGWMYGQTCPMDRFGRPGYYPEDVIRFADMILEGKPTYFD